MTPVGPYGAVSYKRSQLVADPTDAISKRPEDYSLDFFRNAFNDALRFKGS